MITHISLREAKNKLIKEIRYMEDASIQVRIYEESNEYDNQLSFDVEITIFDSGEYASDFCTNSVEIPYTHYDSTDYKNALKEALKRAKTVQKSVLGWFEYSNIPVSKEIALYDSGGSEIIYTKK